MCKHLGRSLVLIVPTLSVLVAIASLPSLASSYRITDLGTLPSAATYAPPWGMNSAGQAVGIIRASPGRFHAYLYTPGTGAVDLGTLGGDDCSQANGINDLGQVVGVSSLGPEGARHAFVYTPGLGMSSLGTLGGTSSAAYAGNNAGQVVGSSMTTDGKFHAFLYTPGSGMADLGTLPGDASSWAGATNDLGQVLGVSTASDGITRRIFVYTPGAGMSDLGTMGRYVSLHALNNVGQVVGSYDDGHVRAFLYTPGLGITSLGAMPGMSSSEAYGVNDEGVVVGDSHGYVGSVSVSHAFVYTAAVGLIDLGGLGGTHSSAYHIDDAGRIVGTSSDADGRTHIVAWDIIPEPSSLLALLAGLGGLGGMVWRRRVR